MSTASRRWCGHSSSRCWQDDAVTGEKWDRVVGQDRAVVLLQRAAERPVHAYVLVGPRGSGTDEAARCFAAAVIAPEDDRTWDLALRGRHPDVIEIDPADNQIRVEHAQEIIDEAYSSPVEGDRKAIIVFEAERLNEAAANKLLKTLEEPPASALLVLVTAGADQLLPTILSRCQRVDFAHLAPGTIERVLAEAGVAPDRADLVARLAGGRLDRARALDGRLAAVRDAFVSATAALDGSGSVVAAHVAAVQEAMQGAMSDLEVAHAEETASLTTELEQAGYPDRVARAQLRRLGDQQKRADRHARTELLLEGITALESVYRDALAGPDAPVLNVDRPALAIDARACGTALDACRAARQVLVEHNPNETLLLERLFLHLPAAR
jgi:DNA polymerase III subunit delta'